MAKKRKKSPKNRLATVPARTETVEIDYEKLAEAIVAANEKAKSGVSNNASRELMKFILTPILHIVSLLCAVFSIGFLVVACQSITNPTSVSTISLDQVGDLLLDKTTDLFKFFLSSMLGLFLIALACFTFFSAKELSNETDRDYVAAIFSNVVSLSALIIALVALLREVL